VPLAGALDGVRVLDLTDGLAGPVAGMLLGDLGADVIKIGPPGDRAARPGRRVWDRNKRWAGFDPTRDADADALDRLVAGADIVLAGPAQWLGRAPGTAIWVVMPPYLLGETPWGPERESAGLVHAWLGHAWSQASYEDVPVDSVFPLALYMQGIWGATVATALVAGQRRGRRTGRLAVVGGAHGGLLVWPGGFEVRRDEPHISVRRSCQALGRCRVRRLALHSGNGVSAHQRVIGLMRRRTGLPMMCVEVTVVPQCRGGLAPAASLIAGLLVRRRLAEPGGACRGWR
jgi:CoA-transferase family III